MGRIPKDLLIGSIHKTSNCGDLKILQYLNSMSVDVVFIDTGYQCTRQSSDIRRGIVKDKLYPSVQGVGYIGEGEYVAKINNKHTKIYKTWCSMMTRCYSSAYQESYPTYIGCSVNILWHNFQEFAKWMSSKDYQGKELDKDIKFTGNRIYGPETCIFVSKKENVSKSICKNYSLISPDNINIKGFNVSELCEKYGLNKGCVSKLMSGKQAKHKGWRLALDE